MPEKRVKTIEPDIELAEKVAHGDEEAFTTLMRRYQRPILNFVYRMIGDATEAQDVAQDVFVRAYRSLSKTTFRPTNGQWSTWLFQIARNAAIDVLRRKQRRPTESLDAMIVAPPSASGGERTAVDDIVARETGKQVAAAIARLPEDQRTAIILSEYEGLPDARIAVVMNCSRKSVEARLYRARRFLRRKLAHCLAR